MTTQTTPLNLTRDEMSLLVEAVGRWQTRCVEDCGQAGVDWRKSRLLADLDNLRDKLREQS